MPIQLSVSIWQGDDTPLLVLRPRRNLSSSLSRSRTARPRVSRGHPHQIALAAVSQDLGQGVLCISLARVNLGFTRYRAGLGSGVGFVRPRSDVTWRLVGRLSRTFQVKPQNSLSGAAIASVSSALNYIHIWVLMLPLVGSGMWFRCVGGVFVGVGGR